MPTVMVSRIDLMRTLSVSLSLFLLGQNIGLGQAPPQLPPVPVPRMNIIAIEGEGAINHVRKREPRNIVVQVRDGNRNPIANATVTFTLPAQGPSGEFFNGSRILTGTTDEQGRVTARAFRPNSVPGKVEIRVSATRGEETASTIVTQFNMEVAAPRGGAGKWIALLAIAGGAAAGGGYALTRKSNGTAPAAAPAPPISITPGSGTVGPPR